MPEQLTIKNLTAAIRALVGVLEAGNYNSEQSRLLQVVKHELGDGPGPVCPHEHTAYEEGDALFCQDCRLRLN